MLYITVQTQTLCQQPGVPLTLMFDLFMREHTDDGQQDAAFTHWQIDPALQAKV